MLKSKRYNFIFVLLAALLAAVLVSCAVAGFGLAKYAKADASHHIDMNIDARYNVSFDPVNGELIVPDEILPEWDSFTTLGALKAVSVGDVLGDIPSAVRTGYSFLGWNENFIPVSYLECTGEGQYIDSGLKGNQNTAIDISFSAKYVAENNRIFGGASSYSADSFEIYTYNTDPTIQMWEVNHSSNAYKFDSNYTVRCYGYGDGETPIYRYQNDPLHPEKYTISNLTNGDSVSNTLGGGNFTTPYTIVFFAIHRAAAASVSPNPVRIYGAKMYQDGDLVRDFHPVIWVGGTAKYSKKGVISEGPVASGTAGFYDALNQVLYINSGNGSDFLKGPYQVDSEMKFSEEITSVTALSAPDDVAFYAHWDPNAYTVYFDENTVSGSTAATVAGGQTEKTVYYDSLFGDFPEIYRPGYIFNGWKDASGTAYSSSDRVKILDDITLKAQWTPAQYKIIFDAYSADELEFSEKTVTFDEYYGTLPVATKAGFSFAGWKIGKSDAVSMMPAGYSQLEYLESSGPQYIDLNFKADQNTAVDVRFSAKSNTNGVKIYGAGQAYNNRSFELYVWDGWEINRNSTFQTGVIKAAGYDETGDPVYRCYNDPANPQSFTIINESDTSGKDRKSLNLGGTGSFSTPYSMLLFADNRPDGVNLNADSSRIYYCKFYDSGTLIRDLVPAVWGGGETTYFSSGSVVTGPLASGTVGMYDLADDIFYINGGSDYFKCGVPVIGGTISEDTPVTSYIDHKAYAQWTPLAAE